MGVLVIVVIYACFPFDFAFRILLGSYHYIVMFWRLYNCYHLYWSSSVWGGTCL